jgi:hypothetical protein
LPWLFTPSVPCKSIPDQLAESNACVRTEAVHSCTSTSRLRHLHLACICSGHTQPLCAPESDLRYCLLSGVQCIGGLARSQRWLQKTSLPCWTKSKRVRSIMSCDMSSVVWYSWRSFEAWRQHCPLHHH